MSVGDKNSTLGTEWARVRGQLRQEFGEDAFKSWLKPLTLLGASEGEIRISAPTRFVRDWIVDHYVDRIQALWRGENPAVRSIVIQVDPARFRQEDAPAKAPAPAAAAQSLPLMNWMSSIMRTSTERNCSLHAIVSLKRSARMKRYMNFSADI